MSEEKNAPETSMEVPVSARMPARIDPDDMFRKIDILRKEVSREPSPNFLAKLLSAGARERERLLQENKNSAIKARNNMIEGMSTVIRVYVDSHKDDLVIRGKSFITATFTQLEGDLYKVNQSTIDSFYETFSQSYSRIDRIPNMTKEQKNLAISEAYARAQRAGSHAEQTFVSILNSMAAQVQKMVEEIGDSPS